MILEAISQTLILILGLATTVLVSSAKPRLVAFAAITGCIAQPCWMYSNFIASQWGMFILSAVQMFIWGVGVYNYWCRGYFNKG